MPTIVGFPLLLMGLLHTAMHCKTLKGPIPITAMGMSPVDVQSPTCSTVHSSPESHPHPPTTPILAKPPSFPNGIGCYAFLTGLPDSILPSNHLFSAQQILYMDPHAQMHSVLQGTYVGHHLLRVSARVRYQLC